MRSSSAASRGSASQERRRAVASTSLARGKNTWPFCSLWVSSKVIAAWSRSSQSAAKPMLMAISSVTEKSTPQLSTERR